LAQAIEDEGSNIFALLTDRRYPGIKVDIRDIELSVIDSTGVVRPVQERDFSEGTLQQLYLSVRIAVAKTLLQTDDLPLVIDDALVDFDDHRFDRAMDIFARLAQTGQQVILFTCHQRYSQHNPGYTALTL
ncbi:MAG: ATP-binding protein, partial [Candidatus Desulforudaceae bacterium]